MRWFFLFFSCVLSHNGLSQFTIGWQNTLGGSQNDILYSIQQTSDGGYICGGVSYSPPTQGPADFWVVKLNSDGSLNWQKKFGGAGTDILRSIQQTADGGYILGGESDSNASGDKSQNSKGLVDYWIIKLDNLGTRVWEKTVGGSGDDYLAKIEQTFDLGYLIGGYSSSSSSGDKSNNTQGGTGFTDFWLVKVDANGVKVWDKTIGGDGGDYLTDFKKTSDGGYILGGRSWSWQSHDKSEAGIGGNDYWIVKIDASGNKVWDKTVGGTSDDDLYSLVETSNNSYILAGKSSSGTYLPFKAQPSYGGSDYWIVKTTYNPMTGLLNIDWDLTYGGSQNDNAYSVSKTVDGDYLVVGDSYSGADGNKTIANAGWEDIWLLRISGAGVLQWQQRLAGSLSDFVYSMQATPDGGCVIGAYSFSTASFEKSASSSQADYWVIKLNPAPLPIELASFSVSPHSTSQVRIEWRTASELNNDYFAVERSTTEASSPEHMQWKSIGTVQGKGTTNEPASYSLTDASPNKGANYYRLKQVDYDGKFKYSEIVKAMVQIPFADEVSIYPNPFSDKINIGIRDDSFSAIIRVINQVGQTVLVERVDSTDSELNVSHLVPGVYSVEILWQNSLIYKKIIKG